MDTSAARRNILARIRAASGRSAQPEAAEREAVADYLNRHPAGPRPAMPADREGLTARFVDEARLMATTVELVDSLDEAIEHINRYGSKHTDAIITGDLAAARKFTARVDSSAVMVNASTRFNDGFQFGLGAEIGISTDKFHARGPCGLKELTTYKYVCWGDGQVRE